uniref:Thyroglobulin type-1 domain-containing protein n=1 Tax=Periophthalmus magnuspinnatus TaxID=409849 RepID=A0A3B4AZJ5_9GOBI
MDQPSEEAPLAADNRTGSQQPLMERTGAPGGSNSYALKVAGITTLVCLLLCAQAFTAYMVFDQKQQIQGLQANNQKMERQMTLRSQVAPQKMVMPMASMPLLEFFDDANSPKPTPKLTKPPSPPSVEEQLLELMKDFELPHFNKSFLANLQTLKHEVNETSWKSLESWLRYWLIFQMAQKAPTPLPASVVKTKCQTEATSAATGLMGTYKPQCDEQGNYRSKQCWHSTGQCWCVDESGTPIQGTSTRGHLNCDQSKTPTRLWPRTVVRAVNRSW